MNSDEPKTDDTQMSDHEKYVERRNRLTLIAAMISVAVVALSWIGARHRDQKPHAAVQPVAVVAKPKSVPVAMLSLEGLPAESVISIDSKTVSLDGFRSTPGHYVLKVHADGYRDLERSLDLAGGRNHYQVKLCPLTSEVNVAISAKTIRTLDLANRTSPWQACTEITCDETQADIERRTDQIVAKTCSNWDRASHRRRGRASTEDSAGLVTEIECDRNLKGPKCRLHIEKGVCVVDAPASTRVESKPFACPESGAIEFSALPTTPPEPS